MRLNIKKNLSPLKWINPSEWQTNEGLSKVVKTFKSIYYTINYEIDPDADLGSHHNIEWHSKRMYLLKYNDAEKVEYIQKLMEIAVQNRDGILSTICTDLANYLIFGEGDGSYPEAYTFFREMIEVDRNLDRKKGT